MVAAVDVRLPRDAWLTSYGACSTARQVSLDEPRTPQRVSGDKCGSGDEPRSGAADDDSDGGGNPHSFKRFSRSVRLASQLGRASPTAGVDADAPAAVSVAGTFVAAAAAAAAAAAPVEPPAGLGPPPKRHWHDTANDLPGLLSLLRESAVLLAVALVTSIVAITAANSNWGATATFFSCFVGLIPLAILLGDLTEGLSGWCGATLGGLLNATLGNATEAIVLVQAVRHGLVGVEQAALLGGVLSNMLLVVGLSFIAGGISTGRTQTFDRRVTVADIGVLFVSMIAVVLPTIAAAAPGGSERDTLADSRSTAVVLLCMYAAFLVYTLSPERAPQPSEADEEAAAAPLLPVKSGKELVVPSGDDGDGEEQPSMSFWMILVLLSGVTVIMAVLSNALVMNVFPVSDALNITPDLVSCIFLPVIGNIAEMATAVIAARRDAIDLSLAVALGSSTQISLFLLPVAAIFGWIIDVPFSFDFAPTFATAFFASVIVVGLVIMDGEANWLKGCMLFGTYVIFAVGLLTNAGAAGVGGPASAPAAAPTA